VRFDVPPFTLAFLRWSGALLVVLPFAIAALRRDWPAIRAGWFWLAVLGMLGIGGFNGLLYHGLRHTSATNALLLQAGIPALVMLADRLLFKVKAERWQSVGVAISTIGVIGIVFQGDPSAALRLEFGRGDVLILAAMLVWALYTVWLRLRPAIAPVSFIAVTFAFGVLAMAPLAGWEAAQGEVVRWTPLAIGSIAYVALLPSLAAYFMYNSATATLGPARAGQAITLMPLFGAVMSTLLLGERLEAYHLIGMALILAGIAVPMLRKRPQQEAGAPDKPPLEDRA
jgi:drug/metabolite transporter (DMT)-like permease